MIAGGLLTIRFGGPAYALEGLTTGLTTVSFGEFDTDQIQFRSAPLEVGLYFL